MKTSMDTEEKMVSAEGIEPARKRKFNNMQDHGWHESASKAVASQQTDCKRIAVLFAGTVRGGSSDERYPEAEGVLCG